VRACIAALSATALLLGASLALARQSSPPVHEKGTDAAVYAELDRAPEKARNRRNPLENDPEAIAAGQLLFERHCAECHGAAAQGSKKAPSLRAEEVQSATPGAIFWILTNGVVRRGMPVWSKLPEPQRWQLVRFLKSLGPHRPDSPEKKAE
jgi:mono/diheme cytochrome c family protein